MKAITKYFKKRKTAIIFLLEKPKQEYTPETYHQLRVEIKKLDAFMHLIKFCAKDFMRKKSFKLFTVIFRQAGKMREIYIEQAMLKNYFTNNVLKAYSVKLKKSQVTALEKYISLVSIKYITKLKKNFREMTSFLKNINKKRGEGYIEKQKKDIEKLLSPINVKPSQLHTLRKKLKKLIYIRKILSYEKPVDPIPQKDNLPELLGKWHDCQIVIRHLKKTIDAEVIDSRAAKQLQKTKTKIMSDKLELFNKVKIEICRLQKENILTAQK